MIHHITISTTLPAILTPITTGVPTTAGTQAVQTGIQTGKRFVLAKKDNCRYEINGKAYTLGEGDILLVWPAEVHEVVDTPQNASLLLQFSSELISAHKDIDLISNKLRSIHFIRRDDSDLYRHLYEN